MIRRNSYGELTHLQDNPLTPEVNRLIGLATKKRHIPCTSDNLSWDRKGRADGWATHQEIYDIRPSPMTILICIRETEGSKYGVRTTSKDYYLIKRHGRGTKVSPTKKSIAAKAAKISGDKLGHAINILEGKSKLTAPRACPDGIAYKQVAILPNGRMASIYDGSDWLINQERRDKALKDHNGGLYVYDDPSKAAYAPFPDNSVHTDAQKIIIKCRVGGTYCRYGEKLAFSRCTPVNVEKIL